MVFLLRRRREPAAAATQEPSQTTDQLEQTFGLDLGDEEDEAAPEPPAQAPSTRACPNCGQNIPAVARFCPYCATPLE